MAARLNNIEIENNGSLLTLRMNLKVKGEVSQSGKSEIISSTHGNFLLGDEKGTVISVNVYRPIPGKDKKKTPVDPE